MIMSSTDTVKDDDLPGFRFHPTDEELVSFYLRRKIEKQLISLEFIKQIDIYKYDPWDLASMQYSLVWLFILIGKKVKFIDSRHVCCRNEWNI